MEVGTEQEYATVFGQDSTSGLVVQQTLDFHLYKYIEDDTGKEVWVRVPVLFREYNDSMELWNTRQHYRGWLPVGPRPRGNLALGKPATPVQYLLFFRTPVWPWMATRTAIGTTTPSPTPTTTRAPGGR